MKLTEYTDYTLRTLIYLGLNPDRLVTIQEIADAYGISKNHLMKVAHQLGLQGLVETTRGRSGGLKLKAAPKSIRIGEVVRLTEGGFPLVECFTPAANECVITRDCKLKSVLKRALNEFFKVLDGCTLADLLHNDQQLVRLLIPVEQQGKQQAASAR